MKYIVGQAKKELGQHWLNDSVILQEIVTAGAVSSSDFVLEIGPGKGTLTEKIVGTGAEVLALEYDNSLIKPLQKRFANCKKFAISEGDIRGYDYNKLPKNYKIIANIPYYLTSNLIRAISETTNSPAVAVLLVQKEVAHRICASPGQMGILSVTAQFYFVCELGVEVAAEYFSPPPKVDSQVVVMRHHKKKLYDVDTGQFFRLVKAGFSEKRKTLRNSLSGGLAISKEDAEILLKKANIPAGSRAQELSLSQWHELYKNFNKVY